jgi:hypothetical protein
VYKEDRGYAISIYPAKRRTLSFCQKDEPYYKYEIKYYNKCGSEEAPFFAWSYENKIGGMGRNIV